MEHDKLWNEINTLKEKTYRQETQIEVLKEKVHEEKSKKEKAQSWNQRVVGIGSSVLMAVIAFTWTQSEKITRYDEQIRVLSEKIDRNTEVIEEVSTDVGETLNYVDENFVKKE